MSTAAIAVEAAVGGLVTAVIGGVGWLLAELIKSMRDDVRETRVELVEVKVDLADMKAQYRANGGTSMRDAINRIELTGNATAATVTAHLIHAAGQDARLDAVVATVNGKA